ncbi:hypothetical protein C8Q70DRAFT_438314 [Cubamyces menziesii]|uniref:Uncharacterized protein n=1 Tax=Trametes cubensis TaxID=1111947 RepID=A0AAD7U3A2_9APHY|nr:hypothetical protein C8Q70DRAFT_438314 [Cubamyces menziesii]KAJ8495416.1 hypothetical protein ONZ51_g1718 [Trametes cubensis]
MSPPGSPSDEQVRALSAAVFGSLAPGRPTLRLLDPYTDELCEYQLVKVSRPLRTTPVLSDSGSGSVSKDSGERRLSRRDSLDQRSELLNKLLLTGSSGRSSVSGPQLSGGRFYPLARLPGPFSVRARGDGTPSLFNDSYPSEASAFSLQPTPVRQLFPDAGVRVPSTPALSSNAAPNISQVGSASGIGLGFSMLKDDGTPFDGLGSLPRRTSTPNRAWASPQEDARLLWTRAPDLPVLKGSTSASSIAPPLLTSASHGPAKPKKHTTARPGMLETPSAAEGEASNIVGRPQSAMLPAKHVEEDVFLSRPIRVPGSLTHGSIRLASAASSSGRVKSSDRYRNSREEAVGGMRRGSVASRQSTRRMTAEWAAALAGDADEKRPVWKP